jgi:hypothetical protein
MDLLKKALQRHDDIIMPTFDPALVRRAMDTLIPGETSIRIEHNHGTYQRGPKVGPPGSARGMDDDAAWLRVPRPEYAGQ